MDPKLHEDVGELLLSEDVIFYESKFYPSWAIRISDVSVIGEFTNQDGPHVSDHFLAIIDNRHHYVEAPVAADGFFELCSLVRIKFGIDVDVALLANVDFSSRVIWPEDLRGAPLFDYFDVPPKSRIRKFLSIFDCGEVESKLSKEVESHLSKNQ